MEKPKKTHFRETNENSTPKCLFEKLCYNFLTPTFFERYSKAFSSKKLYLYVETFIEKKIFLKVTQT